MLQSMFPEWYDHDDDVLASIVQTGTIALDTNVLFQLYRISSAARDEVLNALAHESVRPRLFIPYQVGYEYHRKRIDVAREQSSGYRTLRREIDKIRESVPNLKVADDASGIRDAAVRDEINTAIDTATKELSAGFDNLWNRIAAIRDTHVIKDEDIRRNDPVQNKLEALLSDESQVGSKPDESTLADHKKKATDRYKIKVPPGYEDATGKDAKEDPTGDYLIWRELLDRAALKTGPMLFVTDDKKPDWYQLDKQKRILGPRPELRVEMAAQTTYPYHQTTLEGFLYLAQTHLDLTVDDDTVQQVKSTPSREAIHLAAETDAAHYIWQIMQPPDALIRRPDSAKQSRLPAEMNDDEVLAFLDRHLSTSIDARAYRRVKELRNAIAHGRISIEDLLNEARSTKAWEAYNAVRDELTEEPRPDLPADDES